MTSIRPLLRLAVDLLLRAESPEKPNRLPVLVVDDDEVLAELISIYLGEVGLEVDTRTSLSSARLALQKRKYGHMLLDVAFPQGDGMAFAKEIHNQKQYRDIRIALLTGVRMWMETAKGAGEKELPRAEVQPGKCLTFIGKGGPETSLKEAVQEFVSQNGGIAERSRAVFGVTQGMMWLFFLAGFGTHAGWWSSLLKSIFKLMIQKASEP